MKQVIKTLLLVGGKGTRLRDVVNEVPKPLAPINGVPFLDYLTAKLRRSKLFHVTFLAGYKANLIVKWSKEKKDPLMHYAFSIEDAPLGTGGAIKKAMLTATEPSYYLCLNGDTYFDINLESFCAKSQEIMQKNPHVVCVMALLKIKKSDRYGIVERDSDGKVLQFHPKALAENAEINGGIYFLRGKVTQSIPDSFVSLEAEVFPELVKKGLIYSLSYDAEFIDIGTPEDYEKSQLILAKLLK